MKSNLPTQPSALIGREKELAAAKELLLRDDVRLLTLTGPGGCGKTRLGLEVAQKAVEDFADGVFFIPLATVPDAALVVPTIARTLGVSELPGGLRPEGPLGAARLAPTLLERLKDVLRDRQMLLVLDNFEHVVAAASDVSELLSACPALKILVTSRAVLRVRREREFPVPTLALPNPRTVTGLEQLSKYAAVALFVQRAQEASPNFVLTEENAPMVAEICVRLDGLPLALELAAGRMKMFSVQMILMRLNPLKFLTGGPRDLPARQQTVRNTIAWSHDLLSAEEKALFRRLAVFTGGCTLEAAEAVCRAASDAKFEVLDGLYSLVEKSLVQQQTSNGELRFTMLETIREYALECLVASGEMAEVQRRHLDFFFALLEEGERWVLFLDTHFPFPAGREVYAWLNRCEREHGNLLAALAWSIERGEAETAQRVSGLLWLLWYRNGRFSEGREWFGKVLLLPEAAPHTLLRARVLAGAGYLAGSQTDLAVARDLFQESLAIHRELGDKQGIGGLLVRLGIVASEQGNEAEAEGFYKESKAIFEASGDKLGEAHVLRWLGQLAWRRGELSLARSLHERSLALTQETGNKYNTAYALAALGTFVRAQGDLALARSFFEESLALNREVGDQNDIAALLVQLGSLREDQGDLASARSHYEEGLGIRRELGIKSAIADTLNRLATIAALQCDLALARSLREERLAIVRELGNKSEVSHALGSLGHVAYLQGDLALAQSLLEQSLALAREVGVKFGNEYPRASLARVASRRGEFTLARTLANESLPTWRKLGFKLPIAGLLLLLGYVAEHEGDYKQAAGLYGESLTMTRDVTGAKLQIAPCLEGFSRLSCALGRWERAARLSGAAVALREAIGTPVPPVDRAEYERNVAAVRAQMDEKAFAAAWAEGRAMTLEQATAYALGTELSKS